jgi:low temperature requirement protein LtrA
MRPRDVDEVARASTPLELLFDLCFVVAVAAVSDRLHHALSIGHTLSGVVGYLAVFFAIWWAWMNFTWFASAYDCDDVLYRLATFVQIAGVLMLAAGVPRAFDQRDFTLIVLGYAVMRAGLMAQWLRAAREPESRRVALRYAGGISAAMLGWVGLLLVPAPLRLPLFLVMAAVELTIPVWAELGYRTAWHPHHLAERFGLLTLIVLGETVLSASAAMRSAMDVSGTAVRLVAVAFSGLVVVLALWWLYFGQNAVRILRSKRDALAWGYGHYLIFSSAAAVGAGLAVAVDRAVAPGGGDMGPGAAVAIPVAAFLLCVWWLHVRPHRRGLAVDAAFPAAAALMLLSLLTPVPLPLIAVIAAALVAYTVLVDAGTVPRIWTPQAAAGRIQAPRAGVTRSGAPRARVPRTGAPRAGGPRTGRPRSGPA